MACDPPTPAPQSLCHGLRLGEASVSAPASLGVSQRPLSPEGIVRGLGGDGALLPAGIKTPFLFGCAGPPDRRAEGLRARRFLSFL